MMFRNTFGAVVFCTAVLFYGNCGNGAAERPAAGTISIEHVSGAWARDVRGGAQTFTITFMRTGRYSVRNSEQHGTVYGNWSLAGDTLTIQDTDCKDYIGKYRLELTGSELTFYLISDGSNRPEVIPGVWTKLP